ncbi:MAG: helix-turn-helix domain-containing protein, partial [Pseudomonas sp.]
AEQYLAHSGLSLQEISYLLGFSTPSTFFRAFRRWFGTTPNEHRASLGVAGNAA